MALAHGASRKSWKLLVLPTSCVRQSWKMLVLPTFPTISVIVRTMALAHGVSGKSWKLLVLPTISMLSHRQIMENVGFTNISNNFHDFRNYGSVSRGFSKFMEIVGIVGFTNIFRTQSWKLLVLPTISMLSHRQIMENVGFTNISNNFHDFRNYGSVSRGFSKFMEIVGIVGFTNIFRTQSWKLLVLPTFSMISHRQIMENVGFTNISNNFHDCPNYGSVSRGFSKFMEIVGIVGFANIFLTQSWKMLVLPTFPTISMIVQTMALSHEVSRNSWKLLVLPTFSVRQSWKCWFYQQFP